jgi:hypothetical protein
LVKAVSLCPALGRIKIHTRVIAIGLYHGPFGDATKFVTYDILFTGTLGARRAPWPGRSTSMYCNLPAISPFTCGKITKPEITSLSRKEKRKRNSREKAQKAQKRKRTKSCFASPGDKEFAGAKASQDKLQIYAD